MSGRPAYRSSPSSSSLRDGEYASNASGENSNGRPTVERRVTQLPVLAPPAGGKVYGGGNAVHDGVFANLSAKPERGGEQVDEKPPASVLTYFSAYLGSKTVSRSIKFKSADIRTDL